MTKKEFAKKWDIWLAAHHDETLRERKRELLHDLDEVVKEYTNPLCAGITTAIFELQQAYKKGGKKI